MKLASYLAAGRPGFGVVVDGGVIDLGARLGARFPDLASALQPETQADIARYLRDAPDFALSAVTLLPPIPEPTKIVCVGVNYHSHRLEMAREAVPYPTLFTRFADTLVGHGSALIRPRASTRFDYEGELAVIIGKSTRHASEANALAAVAGYACFNDGSVRDWQRHTSQFTPGKNFPGTGGFGPYLVTADEIPNPQALELVTRVSGVEVQRSSTELMIFSVAKLIAYISTFTTLEPGDVIATGTPAGVGDKRDPPLYLAPGHQIEVEISRVGTLNNGVRDESA